MIYEIKLLIFLYQNKNLKKDTLGCFPKCLFNRVIIQPNQASCEADDFIRLTLWYILFKLGYRS